MAARVHPQVHALSFRYGQRHEAELECARLQVQRVGALSHDVVDLESLATRWSDQSSLIQSSALSVPAAADARPDQIPSTYVPARNTVFLSYALAWAEALAAGSIWIGVNALDYSGYPDCRPAFIDAFAALIKVATKQTVEGDSIELVAPLLHLTKADIIGRGTELGVDYAQTLSCYDPLQRDGTALACGRCESCHLRAEGFRAAGVADPTRYAQARLA